MASNKRKKNPGVGIDFKRVKHKLGKKLPAAQNATDTSFRAKRINLPSQSLAADKARTPVSNRNLSLKDLLAQSTHYSERTRRSAVLGLSDLFFKHRGEISKQAGPILDKLAQRMTDGDSQVRSHFRALLADHILPSLPGVALEPFLPLLMAFVSSALTQVSSDIRADGAAVLDVLMTAAPSTIASRYGEPIMAHFASQLSPGQRSSSLSLRSIPALHKAVQGLRSFLEKARCAAGPNASDLASEACQGSTSSGCCPLAAQRCEWSSATAWAASPGDQPAAEAGGMFDRFPAGSAIMGHLLDAWADCSPGQAALSPDPLALQCMASVLHCMHALLADAPAGTVVRWLGKIDEKVAVHVPVNLAEVTDSAGHSDIDNLTDLNLAAAKLLTCLLARTQQGSFLKPDQVLRWLPKLEGFYLHLLASGSPGGNRPHYHPSTSRSTGAGTLLATLPETLQGVRVLLPCLDAAGRHQLLTAATTLAEQSSPRSASRAACLSFQADLVADPAQWYLAGPDLMSCWLKAAPQLLYQLGASAPGTSTLALRMLHNAGRFCTLGDAISVTLDSMQLEMASLWMHPCRTVQGGGSSVSRAPTLALLPEACQMLATDLIYYYPTIMKATLGAVVAACYCREVPDDLACRLVSVVSARMDTLQPAAFLSFLATLLTGLGKHVPADVADVTSGVLAQRHVVMIGAACLALQAVGDADQALQLMVPLMLQQHSLASSTRRPRIGFAILAAAAAVAAPGAHSVSLHRRGALQDCVGAELSQALPDLCCWQLCRDAAAKAVEGSAGASQSAGPALELLGSFPELLASVVSQMGAALPADMQSDRDKTLQGRALALLLLCQWPALRIKLLSMGGVLTEALSNVRESATEPQPCVAALQACSDLEKTMDTMFGRPLDPHAAR